MGATRQLAALTMHEENEYERGYERGWEDASAFIDRHPHGMPWSALPDHDDDDDDEPEDAFERGRVQGWRERMEQEGWPPTRPPEG